LTIVYVSDFDLAGSGYANIARHLCSELSNKGEEVIVLGLGYNGDEHNYPFTVIPAQMSNIVPMIGQLQSSNVGVEALVVALDIPLQEAIMNQLGVPGEIPYVGIFPLEAGPLCMTWAMALVQMNERLIMSDFGQQELATAGVDSHVITIGVDEDIWRVPHPEERARLREGLGVAEHQCVVLTVADNQERKNLGRSLEIFADFAKERDALYWLVTRPKSVVGWKLEDYAMELGIMDKVAIWERGMEAKNLWSLYAAADIMLLTSKAEGLGLPVLEAMSTRLPVIGTKCAAIEEHLQDGRGLLIEPDYIIRDPWGNSRRYFASKEEGVYLLNLWRNGMTLEDCTTMLDKAQAYVRERGWVKATETLYSAINRIRTDIPIIEKSKNEPTALKMAKTGNITPIKRKRGKRKIVEVLDIIIPVYGRPDLLKDCLVSVKQATEGINTKIIIVDDCGPEKEQLKQIYHSLNGAIQVLQNAKNSGFAATVNRGVAAGKGANILLLNTDVILETDAISIMLERLAKEKVGIVGPRLLFPEDSIDPERPAGKIQHAGIAVNSRGRIVHPLVGWSADHPKANIERSVQAVTGACLMTRREVWKRVQTLYKQSGDPTSGALNEVYGQGTYEDIEYCFAARSEGYTVTYIPSAVGYHHVGASTKNGYPLSRNEMIFNARCQTLLAWDEWTFL
jgi:GT2 family glycosyltransferase/glycosyltransferase involved in cell wall biosynthesis